MKKTNYAEIPSLSTINMGVGASSWGDRVMWNYGRGFCYEDIKSAFEVSIEEGIRFVDTAEVYGRGQSERLLGEFIKDSKRPVIVATKFFPFPWRWNEKSLLSALRHSLERLKLEAVDLYQIHVPLPPIPIETWMKGLAEAVNQGLVHSVGVSNYDRTQMLRAYTALARYNIQLSSNQVLYHLLDREVEKNGLLGRCQELGIRLIAYSPLAQGLLTGKYTVENLPPSIRHRRFRFTITKIQPLLKLMIEIGQDHGGKTNSQVALNWLINKGVLPIPGAKNAQQARQNAGALGWQLTTEQINALDEMSDTINQ